MELKTNEAEFLGRCAEARRLALSFKEPLIVHHYDADGVSSGAIVAAAMLEAGKPLRTKCIKKLDDAAIDELARAGGGGKEVIFADLGGGNPRVNELGDVVVVDHHETRGIAKMQANPMLHGIDGGLELSAAGTAYCVFRLKADLGVVGAVGDMQHPLRGFNRWVLAEGERAGEVRTEYDLRFYGRYCRPLLQFLMYSDDPYVPMISYREERALKLLEDMGISLREGERWRVYADLGTDEKRKLISALAGILASSGRAEGLVGESYVFPNRPKNGTYEANEFSTLLNACGRHGKPEIGLGVCLGEERAYAEAEAMLALHRKMLKEGMAFASAKIQDFGAFRLLDARGVIGEGIVGTVCGMALHQKWGTPLLGLSLGEGNTIKVSSRTPRALLALGIDLGDAMREAAAGAGGIGGGHRIAAGASIPPEGLNAFLLAVGRKFDGKLLGSGERQPMAGGA